MRPEQGDKVVAPRRRGVDMAEQMHREHERIVELLAGRGVDAERKRGRLGGDRRGHGQPPIPQSPMVRADGKRGLMAALR